MVTQAADKQLFMSVLTTVSWWMLCLFTNLDPEAATAMDK
jgi:hypothetical protein